MQYKNPTQGPIALKFTVEKDERSLDIAPGQSVEISAEDETAIKATLGGAAMFGLLVSAEPGKPESPQTTLTGQPGSAPAGAPARGTAPGGPVAGHTQPPKPPPAADAGAVQPVDDQVAPKQADQDVPPQRPSQAPEKGDKPGILDRMKDKVSKR